MKTCILSNIDKFYSMGAGMDSKVHALKNINCKIDKGEFVVLAGPSGSGKTSLANILGFLDTLSNGSYIFQGTDISNYSNEQLTILRREHVGFVFQTFNLIPILSAKENVSLAIELLGTKTNIAHKKALEVLALVGMEDYADRYPNQLSGGQQQRVAIARALIKKPALLIADEPTASLDAVNTSAIMDLMINLNKTFNTICIVCTHDERVISNAPRLVYLEDGKI